MRFAIRGIQRMVVGVGVVIAMTASSFAVDLSKNSALRLAPEDSDIYFGGMQLHEQWNRFTASKLYRDVAQVPFTQRLIETWREQWGNREGQVGQVRQMIDNPNVESLLKLAQDMFSDEAFFFADGQASEMVLRVNSLTDEITAITRSGNPEAILDYFLQLPKAEIDDIPVPVMVAGFKVQDQERVLGKLDELEGILRFGLGSSPMTQSFVEGLERLEDARGIRLSWTIIPEMIPWDLLRRNIALNENGQVADKIEELLEDRQLCVTIGQLDGYLIFALSEEPEAITNLGTTSTLLTNPDMKPLLQRSNESITSVSFVSDAYADAYFQSQLKDFFYRQFTSIYQALEQAMGDQIPDGFASIPDDLGWIDEQIEELVPDFQGQTAFSFLTKSGSEVWNYARTESVVLDASKPLSVLEHVGKDPIAMLAFRLQDRPEYFATARRIVRKIKKYLDLIPELDSLSESDRETWEVGLDRGWPLVVELADIWETQFLPSMKEGQHAWVMQAGNLASKQWYKDMPESNTPLPIPEMATITGLSSKKAMSDAWSSLFELFDSALELVRELEPNAVPSDYSIPRPTQIESVVGERYTYPIPEECPVPKNMNPQVLLTDHFMISSYSDQQTDALVKTQVLEVAKEVVKPSHACSSVAYLDLGRLIQFAKPWIVYAIETSKGSLNAEVIEEEAAMPSVKGSDIIELWSALGAAGQFASVTHSGDDGGTVTRTVITQP